MNKKPQSNSTSDMPHRNSRPLYTIWNSPRSTVRHIVNWDPEYRVFGITTIAGMAYMLMDLLEKIPEDNPAMFALFIPLGLVGGAVYGFMNLYLGGFFLSLVAGWMGGYANSYEVRSAIAWSNVPAAFALLPIFIGHIALFIWYLMGDVQLISASLIDNILLVVYALYIFLWVYGYILFIGTFAEVQRFTLLRSFFAILLTHTLWILPVIMFGVI